MACVGVVTLVSLAVGYPIVVIFTIIGGWLPRSSSPNYNRGLATPYYNAYDTVVTGYPVQPRCTAVVTP